MEFLCYRDIWTRYVKRKEIMKQMEFSLNMFAWMYLTPMMLFGKNDKRWVRVLSFIVTCFWCSHILFTCVISFPVLFYGLVCWITEI